MLVGPAIVGAIGPVRAPVQLVAAGVLVVLALRNQFGRHDPTAAPPRAIGRSYLTVLTFTLLNPITITYFATLTIGLPELAHDATSRLLFVAGAALASLSWQSVLAAAGASLRGRLPQRFGVVTTLFGTLVMLGFAVRIALQAVS